MIPEVQASVNNLARLLMQRGLYFVGCLLFAALLPRLMGVEIFGQYALITSLSIWFVLPSNLGFTQIISRHVPQMAVQETREHIGKFFGNLLILRIASGALGAGLYVLLTLLWLRDLDRMILVIMGVTIFVRAVSHQIFSLFLGLNQAGRWGMDETVRRWLWLILMIRRVRLGRTPGRLPGNASVGGGSAGIRPVVGPAPFLLVQSAVESGNRDRRFSVSD